MCPTVKELTYVEESARYDIPLKNDLDIFLRDGTVDFDSFNPINEDLMKWICYTNKKRIEKNTQCLDKRLEESDKDFY